MTTKLIFRNRVVLSTGPRNARPQSVLAYEQLPIQRSKKSFLERAEMNLIDTSPIPETSPESPFRAGIPYRDPSTGLTYRIVRALDMSEGWGTADFWMQRYGVVDFRFVQEWVERGWLDAAMVRGSPTKRYRCRDERKIYAKMWDLWKTKNSLGPGEKERIRKALIKLKPLFEEK